MKKEIKKVIQQIPVKELREFVMQQIGENPQNQIAFLRYFVTISLRKNREICT